MNILELESALEKIDDDKYASIIELIVEAVRDYPITGLIDVDLFLDEVERKIGGHISSKNLMVYIESIKMGRCENDIWIETSINSLLQAFQLMERANISLDDVFQKVKSC